LRFLKPLGSIENDWLSDPFTATPHCEVEAPTMRIIQATLDHLDLLTPLFVKYREFYGELPFPDSSRAFLEKRLRRKESVIYLALQDDDDNKLMGFCQLYPSYSSLSLKRVWILNDIYVAEDARRMLVADHLIKSAKKMAKETQAVRMRVSTSSNNEAAKKTYESIGFKVDTQFVNYVLPISEG
jgi:ribosomal protein S18 acetylase RimI-like enzyme